MALLAIAYPKLSALDFEKIQRFRQQHDVLYFNVVEPHITLVFPVSDISENIFVEHIRKCCEGRSKITFVIRCATLNKDAFSPWYHTFLVPDEGYSSIVQLHDHFYQGILESQLRMDIDYIPHIGVGNSQDPLQCKKLAAEWNEQPFSIKGTIDKVTVVWYEKNHIEPVAVLELQ